MKLSIIIPVYNVQDYVYECLASIQKQSFKDYEVIIINDGSTDDSLTICEAFCQKDQRFKVYTKENGGLSSSRNYGLQFVQGEYLTFLDSDDFIADNIYLDMIELLDTKELDIVMADIEFYFENGHNFILKGLNRRANKLNNKAALLSPLFAWNKIYRTEYFNKIGVLYPEGLWYEDIPVTCALFANTSKIDSVDKLGYYYRQRTSSIMKQTNNKMNDIFTIMESVYQYFDKHNLLSEFNVELEYLFIEQIMLYGQFRFIKTKEYARYYKKSVDFMNKYYPNYQKNHYLKLLSLKNQLFISSYNKFTMVLYKIYLKGR